MARRPSQKRKEALDIWLSSGRKKKLKLIAEELGISAGQVRKWKCIDKWDEISAGKTGAPFGNKNAIGNKGGKGGPHGNKKAIGNKGGAAPLNNENAVKHGQFRKWLPNDDELREIYDAAREGMSPLDILWEEILVSFTNFIYAQKIMYVKDKDDTTKVIKKEKDSDKGTEIEYEYQFAWDKQARALTAQAAASRALTSKIKQYEEMLRTLPPDEVKEEHRLRASKIRADIKAVEAKVW